MYFQFPYLQREAVSIKSPFFSFSIHCAAAFSLEKAVEISGLTYKEFPDLLNSKNIKVELLS